MPGVNQLNVWKYKRVEYSPGFDFSNSANTTNSETIIYSNSQGQTMLQVTIQTATGAESMDYYRYDSYGNVYYHAFPSAVTGYDDADWDLVNWPVFGGGEANSVGKEYIAADSGLVEETTDTSVYSGTGLEFLPYETIDGMGSSMDSEVVKTLTTYTTHTFNGISTPLVSDSYVYTDGGYVARHTLRLHMEREDTSSGTSYLLMIKTTSPTVSSDHNGSDEPDISYQILDSYGRTIWTQDADGYGTFNVAYNATSGAVSQTIVDAASSQLPSSLTTILHNLTLPAHTTGLGLTTNTVSDALGRTTQTTDPNGNVTYTVYDDADHAVFTFPDIAMIGTTNSIHNHGPSDHEPDATALYPDPWAAGRFRRLMTRRSRSVARLRYQAHRSYCQDSCSARDLQYRHESAEFYIERSKFTVQRFNRFLRTPLITPPSKWWSQTAITTSEPTGATSTYMALRQIPLHGLSNGQFLRHDVQLQRQRVFKRK